MPIQGYMTILVPYKYKRALNDLFNTHKEIFRENKNKIRHLILPTTQGSHI